jgi:hypothetical protein
VFGSEEGSTVIERLEENRNKSWEGGGKKKGSVGAVKIR